MRLSPPLAAALLLFFSMPLAACKRDAPGADPTPVPSAAVAAPELSIGKPPPDFTAIDHTGAEIKLSGLKGKPVVVYFYPKDETSGCTKEASSFRDNWQELEKTGVVVIGISTDSLDSHKSFAKNHDLPFHLVSDPTGAIAKSFGVPNRVGFLSRQTVVIGADGNVKKIYRDVDVSKHVSEVLADLQS